MTRPHIPEAEALLDEYIEIFGHQKSCKKSRKHLCMK